MKTLLALAVLYACPAPISAETFQIDPAHSSVSFRVKHMMVSKVVGRFQKFSGAFDYVKGKPQARRTEATIDVKSINTDVEARDNHLRTGDFFDADKCPNITFKSTTVADVRGDAAKLHGDLTMHCVTKPVVLDLEIGGMTTDAKGAKAGATATGRINRKDFGMLWNKTLDSGGLALGEDIDITIEVEDNAKKG